MGWVGGWNTFAMSTARAIRRCHVMLNDFLSITSQMLPFGQYAIHIQMCIGSTQALTKMLRFWWRNFRIYSRRRKSFTNAEKWNLSRRAEIVIERTNNCHNGAMQICKHLIFWKCRKDLQSVRWHPNEKEQKQSEQGFTKKWLTSSKAKKLLIKSTLRKTKTFISYLFIFWNTDPTKPLLT